MDIRFTDAGQDSLLEPLTCRRGLLEIQLAGGTLKDAISARFEAHAGDAMKGRVLSTVSNFWPSEALAEALGKVKGDAMVSLDDGRIVAWLSASGEMPKNGEDIQFDAKSLMIKYPWDLLTVNEDIVGKLKANSIKGVVRDGVTIDGRLVLGEGSTVLPGVYIEGNVVVGRNSKIGPNCYIRGCTSIGDNCHVGQAVEIKNSILMEKVSAGHLSYIGDSIVCPKTNFGAGTITANFRHDGKNHRSAIKGELVDTGRRKFGSIIGDNVHTGIHTSIYPGRKIWPEASTRPGEVVQRDLMAPVA